jgi:hypothetical protein
VDGLSGVDIESAPMEINPEDAMKNEGVFFKRWRLSRFDPSCRAPHVRDADSDGAAVHAPDVFFNGLRFVPGCANLRCGPDERWHGATPLFLPQMNTDRKRR